MVVLGAAYGSASALRSLGFESIFATISITDAMRIFLALYLSGITMSLSLLVLGLVMIFRKRTRPVGWLGISASFITLLTVFTPSAFAVAVSIVSSITLIIGAALSVIGSILVLRIPFPLPEPAFLSTYEIASSAVLSALTAVFTGIAFVPSPTGGYTHVGDTIIFVASLLFGSKVGAVTGAIGSVAADLWVGYPRWFVSIPAHGLEGLIAGLGKRRSVPIQVLACVAGGIVMASVYFCVNLFIKGWALAIISYARDILGQAMISLLLAIVLTRTVKRVLPRFKS
jgi:uncharacterized membrane protein